MEFKLPELGEGVHEGELVTWRVKPGDMVEHDQPLMEVMTDKATIEVPSPFKAKVASLHAKEGETVHVGQLLIRFEDAAGATASAPAPAKAAEPEPAPAATKPATPAAGAVAASKPAAAPAPAPAAPAARANGNGHGPGPSAAVTPGGVHILAAPATRRFARERGIDLAAVPGTGPHGRVMREDVERVMREGSPMASPAMRMPSAAVYPAGGEERVAFKGLRKKIAEKMRESKDNAAHFTYVEEADATALVELRKQAKDMGAAMGIKVTFLPFVMKAMVAALRKYPILNSRLDTETNEIVYRHYYNIGLSIQTDEGLTAPNVKNVEQKGVLQLAKEIDDLVTRARAKKLTREDLQGGTITLTNAGSIGGLFATPVINYPEVAILGFNKIFRKPVVVKGAGGKEEIAIRDWTYFSISLDHRIVDGAIAAEFMKEFIRYIENPSLLVL